MVVVYSHSIQNDQYIQHGNILYVLRYLLIQYNRTCAYLVIMKLSCWDSPHDTFPAMADCLHVKSLLMKHSLFFVVYCTSVPTLLSHRLRNKYVTYYLKCVVRDWDSLLYMSTMNFNSDMRLMFKKRGKASPTRARDLFRPLCSERLSMAWQMVSFAWENTATR